jgi:uncharacterized protein (TIRG00374 family)
MASMDKPVKLPLRGERRYAVGMVLLVLLGAVVILADWEDIRLTLMAAEWQLLPFAILFTIISYACISYSFALVNGLYGVGANPHTLAEIGFVSTVINHVLTSGGAAGYSIRYVLMKRLGVKAEDIFAASILHFYLTSLAMLGMLPLGLLYLLTNSEVSSGLATFMVVVAGTLILVFALCTSLIFSQSMRSKVLAPIVNLVEKLTRREIKGAVHTFDITMSRGVKAIKERPGTLVAIMALVLVDWLTSGGTLWVCFLALGSSIAPGVLMTGFVIGIMAGVLSMIPGGLGVQEGSMAGIFALMDVPFDQALLASLLFRIVYFFLPYLISMAFHYRIMQKDVA